MVREGYVSTVLSAGMGGGGKGGKGGKGNKGEMTLKRDAVLREFKEGLTKILICTNVAARGLDIPGVLLVINYDMPRKGRGRDTECDLETYPHRVGRTARFGRKGSSVNFICNRQDAEDLEKIKAHYSLDIEQMTDPEVSDERREMRDER